MNLIIHCLRGWEQFLQKNLLFFSCNYSQLMVNCWFGARWFGYLESPYEKDWNSWGPYPEFESQTTKRPKQGGPLVVIDRVITPINGLING